MDILEHASLHRAVVGWRDRTGSISAVSLQLRERQIWARAWRDLDSSHKKRKVQDSVESYTIRVRKQTFCSHMLRCTPISCKCSQDSGALTTSREGNWEPETTKRLLK